MTSRSPGRSSPSSPRCSSPPARGRRHAGAIRSRPVGSGRLSQAAGTELTVLGAASLKGVLEKAKAAYETANPRDDRDDLDRFIDRARGDPDRAGRARRRVPLADTANPQKLVDGGFAGRPERPCSPATS